MHVLGKRMKRFIPALGSVAGAGLLAVTVTSASAATLRAPAPAAVPVFALRGSVAGGVKSIGPELALTFVFTETGKGPGSAYEDLNITKVTNARVSGYPACVSPDGSAFDPDYPACEPGLIARGQSASMVITAHVRGVSGKASVRVCLHNEATQIQAPCKTLSVTIG